MRRLTLACCAIALAACAKSEDMTDTAATAAMPAGPAPISLADLAGVWTVRGTNMAGDSTLVTYEVMATADTMGWTITFPGQQPIPLRVVGVAGDSVMIDAGPYPSALRKGVTVRTSGAFRLRDGRMVGTNVARYDTKGADSVLMLRSEGTRKP